MNPVPVMVRLSPDVPAVTLVRDSDATAGAGFEVGGGGGGGVEPAPPQAESQNAETNSRRAVCTYLLRLGRCSMGNIWPPFAASQTTRSDLDCPLTGTVSKNVRGLP